MIAFILMGTGHGVIVIPVALKDGVLTKLRKQALRMSLWQNDAPSCYWEELVGF